MNGFVYYAPTKAVFGRGGEEQVGELIREQGCKQVLIHYGGGSVLRSGLLDRVRRSMDAAGLAALWGTWARYVYPQRPERFAGYATNVMGVESGGTAEELAVKGIEAMEAFYREIHMPTSLTELGIAPIDAEIEEMAEKCSRAFPDGIGIVRRLRKQDMVAIFRAAR